MQSEQHSQISPQKSDVKRFWTTNLANAQSVDDEGGLKFGNVLQSLQRRLPVIASVTIVVTSLAVFRSATSKPNYQSGFEILAKPITEETRVISAVTLNNRDTEATKDTKEAISPTTLKILKSSRILTPIAEKLKAKYPNIDDDSLAEGLTIKTENQVLSVSYQDKDSKKVKEILDLVSQAYLAYSLEERLSDVQQGLDFVNSQLPQVQERVSNLQDKLQTFRQQYNLIDPDSSSKQLAAETSTIAQQKLETKVKLDEARSLYQDLSRQVSEPVDETKVSSLLQDNPRYQAILTQIQVVDGQIAKELSIYQENTDKVQALKDQRANLIPLLRLEEERAKELVASRIRDLEARSEILAQVEEKLNQEVKQLSSISRQYTDIQQEIKITNDNLNQFLTKREALRIDAGQRKTPWQILTPVKDPVSSSADVKRNGVLGAILGLLLGSGLALLLDKLSNLLRTPDEVKDVAKLPILGVIPFNSDLNQEEIIDDTSEIIPLERNLIENEALHTLGKPTKIVNLKYWINRATKGRKSDSSSIKPYYMTSIFLEAFRALYTNIRLLNPDLEVRSIVISSSMPSEGKSTSSVYLAQAAAALGKRVLLVDADLRRPNIHEQLLLSNTLGLSNLISTDLTFDQVLQRSPIEPNLSILTSGQIPPDPTRLLSSQKMQNLMQLFQESFDLVIYDTPPLLGLVDSKLIAAKTDGIVIVVGLDKAKASNLTQALDLLSNSPIGVFGVIVNGSKDYDADLNKTYSLY
ncbi:GumC family protein [Pseudanabaena yagii]|uniref:non-specific protein-tyrosine kinase n=1 Tax=Pseudanabaena yagii GIHE-NHR1 TaxID=2722753 RepID=A0ABX1LWN3_9CYAN|nr:tyrosine-protein kinase domain-containing protein [Pseudanabaena yagii]NMF60574.1 polysaccharide biosynthesis tyrosine autokinase [Pseudanabaena yagii GIHE-NHR1]